MDELETSLLQYHKKIAISLDKGLTSVREAAVDSVETMGMGLIEQLTIYLIFLMIMMMFMKKYLMKIVVFIE